MNGKSTWNYRVVRRLGLPTSENDHWSYFISEVHYSPAGKINGWTVAQSAWGASLTDLRRDLKLMLKDTKRPILEEKTVRGRLRLVEVEP